MHERVSMNESTRTLRHARPVTYTCQWCTREHTELRYPSPAPRYCPTCKPHARHARVAEWERRRRERAAARAQRSLEWPRREARLPASGTGTLDTAPSE